MYLEYIMWHSLLEAVDIEARGAHICSLLDEAVMDEEGQRVLHSKIQLLPKALLQVRLACIIQLALSQRHSCIIWPSVNPTPQQR